jgi:hypothetical protein
MNRAKRTGLAKDRLKMTLLGGRFSLGDLAQASGVTPDQALELIGVLRSEGCAIDEEEVLTSTRNYTVYRLRSDRKPSEKVVVREAVAEWHKKPVEDRIVELERYAGFFPEGHSQRRAAALQIEQTKRFG